MTTLYPKLRVADDTGGLDAAALRWIRRRLAQAAQELSLKSVEVNVVVVGDAGMSDLHRRFSGVAGTTDVLTFDLSDTAGGGPRGALEGEVYICLDEARRRSSELAHDARRELLLYALHGLLHLAGYDDHDPRDYERMHAREDEVLRAIGVGGVFAGPAGGAA